MLTTILHHNEKGYFERYFMGGLSDQVMHLLFGKLKSTSMSLHLPEVKVTCGMVHNDLIFIAMKKTLIVF